MQASLLRLLSKIRRSRTRLSKQVKSYLPVKTSQSSRACDQRTLDAKTYALEYTLLTLDNCNSNVNTNAGKGDSQQPQMRQVDLRRTGRNTKRRIVQNALQTEDMDQERLLQKVRERLDRYKKPNCLTTAQCHAAAAAAAAAVCACPLVHSCRSVASLSVEQISLRSVQCLTPDLYA